MPWPMANSENYPQAAPTVSVEWCSACRDWGRWTRVPAHRWKFGGEAGAHNHGPGLRHVWNGKITHLRQSTETRRNAAYGYLPLTDTAVSDVAVTASRNAVYCLAGCPSFGGWSTPPQAVILGASNIREHHHDRADATELSFRAWSDKNRSLGKANLALPIILLMRSFSASGSSPLLQPCPWSWAKKQIRRNTTNSHLKVVNIRNQASRWYYQ